MKNTLIQKKRSRVGRMETSSLSPVNEKKQYATMARQISKRFRSLEKKSTMRSGRTNISLTKL